jgi:hypothetical protein
MMKTGRNLPAGNSEPKIGNIADFAGQPTAGYLPVGCVLPSNVPLQFGVF